MVQIGRYATCETPKRCWPSSRNVAAEAAPGGRLSTTLQPGPVSSGVRAGLHERRCDDQGATEETVDGMSLERIGALIDELRHERYRWTPVRRVLHPERTGKLAPLGIPMIRAYCTPYQKPWGWSPGRLPGSAFVRGSLAASSPANQLTRGRSLRRPFLPATPHRLPQALDDLGRQPDPPRPVRRRLDAIQATRLAPGGDGGHVHVQGLRRGLGRTAAIATLASAGTPPALPGNRCESDGRSESTGPCSP